MAMIEPSEAIVIAKTSAAAYTTVHVDPPSVERRRCCPFDQPLAATISVPDRHAVSAEVISYPSIALTRFQLSPSSDERYIAPARVIAISDPVESIAISLTLRSVNP